MTPQKRIIKIIAMPLGLIIGLSLALLLPCNLTVVFVVAFCAGVAMLAWMKGRWIL